MSPPDVSGIPSDTLPDYWADPEEKYLMIGSIIFLALVVLLGIYGVTHV